MLLSLDGSFFCGMEIFMQIIRKVLIESEKKDFALEINRQNECKPQYPFGVAVDIGTTTVVMGLYDMQSGKRINSAQARNAQTQMGSDVVMRLMHCQNGHQKKLQNMIVEQIEAMVQDMAEGFCNMADIGFMTVVGNTTMCHIFAGQDTSGLAGSPFKPAYRGSLTFKGKEVHFQKLQDVIVYIVAGIDAHVGADAVAMAASLEIMDDSCCSLAVDIGTNAEMVFNYFGELFACSVPAGPAFEGAEISCGMRGERGAIAGVRLAYQTGNVILEVLEEGITGAGKCIPKGICGSGLIDVIAGLRQGGLIKEDGYLLTRQEAEGLNIHPDLTARLHEDGFVLYQPDSEDEGNGEVILTRQDIRQFQLAKAAVQTGIRLLLAGSGCSVDQLQHLYIAGVFGGHISQSSACKTGLFPVMKQGRLRVVGNAAGDGAARALLVKEFREKSQEFARKVQHIDMAQEECFKKEYLTAMDIEAWGTV